MEIQKLQFKRQSCSEILLGNDLVNKIASRINRIRTAKKTVIVTNEIVARWYLQPLLAELRTRGVQAQEIILSDGEKFKTKETAFSIIARLCELEMDRDCPIIALGGGVITDLTGFAASVYKRGIPLILLPTTLMAMVDASIGGKNGINLDTGKNLVGTIYQPVFTAIDVSYLQTLPLTQLSYGMAEVIKHGAISDSAYFRFILKNTEQIKSKQISLLQRLIRRSIHIKKSMVVEDELDQGKRRMLNFGHTLGHALEAAGGYVRLHHGEAVGLGMLMALKAASLLKVLEEDYSEALLQIFKEFNLPTKFPRELTKDNIINVICQDKKKNQEGYKFILPIRLGKVTEFCVKPEQIHNLLKKITDSFQ
jgi:3-dehydroquinate synthase